MIQKASLFLVFVFLGIGFYKSSDFTLIVAGVAIFMLGMIFMEGGFKAFSGGILESILKKTTNTLGKSIVSGFVSTSIVQSSSLISVIIISFLSAQLLGLKEAIGIIFGSNIGSTTTAWIIGGLGLKVKISSYALPMLVFGVVLKFTKSK
ncbi:MAG: phosphate:Na+ symporter, partial [Campylobacterota bacterium]|nr:phosphate:Na+ symporter [Campylobacterota bacterium]